MECPKHQVVRCVSKAGPMEYFFCYRLSSHMYEQSVTSQLTGTKHTGEATQNILYNNNKLFIKGYKYIVIY